MEPQKNELDKLNEELEFSYDTSIIGGINKDNLYADPENNDFIWPENYIRINHVRWCDTVEGPNHSDPHIFVESFDGLNNNFDRIPFRESKEEYDEFGHIQTPVVRAFLESPFNDVNMITRETTRYAEKLDAEFIRYQAFKRQYDPVAEEEFTQWKRTKDQGEEYPENTNFTEPDRRSVWEVMSGATTEDLFKFKLDIFEQEVVQNSENRELRSKIRKAKSICEVCASYQQLLDAESSDEEQPSEETTEE